MLPIYMIVKFSFLRVGEFFILLEENLKNNNYTLSGWTKTSNEKARLVCTFYNNELRQTKGTSISLEDVPGFKNTFIKIF